MGPTIADLYLMGLDPGLSSLLLAFTRQGWLFVFCLALKLKFSQIMTFPPISKWGRVSSHSSDSPPFRDFIILSVKNAWVKHLPTAIHINTIWLASGLSGLSLKISAITPVLFFSAGGQLYHETSLCSSWATEMVFEGGRRGCPPSCCLQVFLELTVSVGSPKKRSHGVAIFSHMYRNIIPALSGMEAAKGGKAACTDKGKHLTF